MNAVYIFIISALLVFMVLKELMHAREREKLIILMKSQNPSEYKSYIKKEKPPDKKPVRLRRRVFGTVKGGGDN